MQTVRATSAPLSSTSGPRRSGENLGLAAHPSGTLRISPADAASLGLTGGAMARVTTRTGSVEVPVEIHDGLQPGHVSLPNGLGLSYPGPDGAPVVTGAAPNELTAAGDRDPYAGTPWHKHVPARVEAVAV
ncbi:hypothetical protein GCM10023194_55030 [Planotetraspora phitsanulokensis]|uniref:Molybdopterin dinucleotide-binding domain-containing protein n=1 Tax=Planotetraspora phitsanulokensis TaxID=575192 RepID=A0A8J3UG88_9ACTN|nr:hypothetical protein Pph01_67770 [Planotetraspora phitsanulokensis]